MHYLTMFTTNELITMTNTINTHNEVQCYTPNYFLNTKQIYTLQTKLN